MGVNPNDVFSTLQIYLGSFYVNDFNRFGRTWQVNVQADANFRQQIDDLKQLKVRNDRGDMVPLAGMMKGTGAPGLASASSTKPHGLVKVSFIVRASTASNDWVCESNCWPQIRPAPGAMW